MNCPACRGPLESLMVGNLILEVCTKGCGGVWFEPFVLERLLEEDRDAARAFVRARRGIDRHPVEPGPRECPRCELPMLQRMANAASPSHVFECPGCAGRWVDHDDLVQMITDDTSEEERQKATDRMFYERFG